MVSVSTADVALISFMTTERIRPKPFMTGLLRGKSPIRTFINKAGNVRLDV
jgi:hypothetical protein